MMNGVSLTMAESNRPIPFTFVFKRNGLSYMAIYAELRASAGSITNVGLQVVNDVIGEVGEYHFSIELQNPLSSTSRILLDFPYEIKVEGVNPLC